MQQFVMLVGPSGCGKSTWAKSYTKNYNHQYVIFSSDAIRGELWSDENDQQNPAKIFEILHQRIRKALQQGNNVIYDATNLNAKRRKNYLKQLKQQMAADGIEVKFIALVMVTSFEDCLRNNEKRVRHVPVSVIEKHFKTICLPWYDEGWDDIGYYLNSQIIPWGDVLKMIDIPHNNEHHQYDVLEHSLKVAAAMGKPFSKYWKIGALHDFGKPFTKVFQKLNGKVDGQAHYYGHSFVGAYLSLLVDENDTDGFKKYKRAMVIQYHMEPFLRDEKALESLYDRIDDKEIIGLIQKLNKADEEYA